MQKTFYTITNIIKTFIKPFKTEQEAVEFTESLGEGYEIVDTETITISTEQKLAEDKLFCDELVQSFVLTNRNIGITTEQSLSLMAKFKDILSFAQVGAIDSVHELLQNVVIDEVYTQERKDADLQKIVEYMNS